MINKYYKIEVTDSHLHIDNVIEIYHFSDTDLFVSVSNKQVNIVGENLTIHELMQNSLVVRGKILEIRFKDNHEK